MPVSALPKIFRWIFTVLEWLFAVAAICIVVAIVIDPKLPPGTHFGPVAIDFAGQSGSVQLLPAGSDSDFTVSALRGSVMLFVKQAGGLVSTLMHFGLPLALLRVIFFVALFDLLRRLFRNVGRGESFTTQSVRLVQTIGVVLILFSLVTAFTDAWFVQAMFGYISQHAVLTISGTQLRLPTMHGQILPHPNVLNPVLLSGLLVLAISEVFRQGLALKSENDLTV